jgi:pyridoxamine 5'-phosphate oxidase family protein
MSFQLTDAERTYVQSTPLARLATSSPSGEPDVAAVMTIFHGGESAFLVGGLEMTHTRKFHNCRRNPRFSLVFDDVVFEPSYSPRGVKVTGAVEIRTADEALNLGTLGVPILVLRPEKKWSWGIEDPSFVDGHFTLRVDDAPAAALDA